MKYQSPTQIVDISNWPPDEEFSIFPEGTREKNAIYCPSPAPFPFLIENHRYLFKLSDRRYPSQFWSEIIAYKIGHFMGVDVPPAFAAINSREKKTGALIEWFYGFPDTAQEFVGYISGADYLKRLIKGFDQKKGTQHNLRTLFQVASFLEKIGRIKDTAEHWGKTFLFDALIGNTDRHQDNWGIMWYGTEDEPRAEFSPAFDNGTSLGHNILEDRLSRYLDKSHLDRFISRGRHHIRWSINDPDQCGHIELIQRYTKAYPDSKTSMLKALMFDSSELFDSIKELKDFNAPVKFSDDRYNFVINQLQRRKELLSRILEN